MGERLTEQKREIRIYRFKKILFFDSTEAGQLRAEDRYMRVCRRSPHPHIYPSFLLEACFLSALILRNLVNSDMACMVA
jgi:hypothetical protein